MLVSFIHCKGPKSFSNTQQTGPMTEILHDIKSQKWTVQLCIMTFPVLPNVVIRRCQHIVVGEERAPALWNQPLVLCHTKHNGTSQLMSRISKNVKCCMCFFGKMYQYPMDINKDQTERSFTCWLEGNHQHLRIWRLLDSTQEVWVKTSKYKCHFNFELSLQPVLHMSPGYRYQIKVLHLLFSITGKTPVLRLLCL